MKDLLAVLAGGLFSYSFFGKEPYWFVALLGAALCICILRGGLLG